jgi:hypothetical protein
LALKYSKQKSGLGIGHDWNFSFSHAKTKYVTLAHQDDVYDPAYTENCLRISESSRTRLFVLHLMAKF